MLQRDQGNRFTVIYIYGRKREREIEATFGFYIGWVLQKWGGSLEDRRLHICTYVDDN